MQVGEAKSIAREWVGTEAAALPGFVGAVFHGSVNWLADDEELPPASDLDVMVVVEDARPPRKFGKLVHRGVLLEVSCLSRDEIRTPEQVLANYRLAGSFAAASVIADPAGVLMNLSVAVARDYAKRRWVAARCDDAERNARTHLASWSPETLFENQVTSWLFGTGVTTHVLLAAGLRNPTVRKRYLAARELLADYGRLGFYQELLTLLGCAEISRTQVEEHLRAVASAFDAAKQVIATPLFFFADISDRARPIAIDGSRELIDSGHHREAVFWLVATYSRCLTVLRNDAPERLDGFEPGFRRLVADLGIRSSADLRERVAETAAFLPIVRGVAEEIMAENPLIEPDR
jgi:hypothetical protein